MLVEKLTLHLLSALVVALDHLEEAALIVQSQVLVDYPAVALRVGAHYTPVITRNLVRFHLLPLEAHRAALFEKTLAFVRAVNYLQWTVKLGMTFYLTTLD